MSGRNSTAPFGRWPAAGGCDTYVGTPCSDGNTLPCGVPACSWPERQSGQDMALFFFLFLFAFWEEWEEWEEWFLAFRGMDGCWCGERECV